MISDPLDLLKTYLNDKVAIKLKSGETFAGILQGFDEFHNAVIKTEDCVKFIRGENIIFIGQK